MCGDVLDWLSVVFMCNTLGTLRVLLTITVTRHSTQRRFPLPLHSPHIMPNNTNLLSVSPAHTHLSGRLL